MCALSGFDHFDQTHICGRQNLSLRDISARLDITKGRRRASTPSPATVLRMLRDHDDQTTAAPDAVGT